MTPLAQMIARELTLPIRRRTMRDGAGILGRLDDIHCFDITAALPLVAELAKAMVDHGSDIRATFLPAPKTWIEMTEGRLRSGVLLEDRGSTVRRSFATWTPAFGLASEGQGAGPLGCSPIVQGPVDTDAFPSLSKARAQISTAAKAGADWLGDEYFRAAALTLINSPRIIGRRQHAPHRGLERALTRALGVQGKFPLQAWTEIILRVAPCEDASSETPVEAHLTGARALHFCRSHLRVRAGRLEVVRAHWRGDASLGIKQSRYLLAA